MITEQVPGNAILVEKSSVEQLQDNQRYRYACAFAAEHNLSPHQEPGAQQSGYIKDKEGNYETHSNGIARRFSVLSCRNGTLVWIFESKNLMAYTVEVRTISGATKASFLYQIIELEQLLEKHLHVADRTHALSSFRNEVLDLPLSKLVEEYKRLMKAETGSFDQSRLSIIQFELSEKLEELIEEAFEGTGQIGRKLYLKTLRQALEANEISLPLYLISYLCVATGFTFIWKVKELTTRDLEIGSKLTPEHPDYKIWLKETAQLTCFVYEQLAALSKSTGAPPAKHKLVKFAKRKATIGNPAEFP